MPHHLVSEGELKTFCIYCKAEVPVEGWVSDWHQEKHYKSVRCRACGKSLHIRVDFDGSGHDSWNGKSWSSAILKKSEGKKENIEDRIKILEKMKVVERHYPKSK